MKNRFVVCICIACALILCVICSVQIWSVNKRYPDTVVKSASYGEIVSLDGFEMRLTDVKYMDYEEIKKEYNDSISQSIYEKYSRYYEQTFILAGIEIKNTNNEEKSIELYQTVLGNNTTSNGVDVELFGLFNEKQDLLCPALQSGESVNVVLTYSFLNRYFKNEKVDGMWLTLSLYPEKNVIKL